MRPRVFVVQPVPEVAIGILRGVADVEIYPHIDRQISAGELASAARNADYIFAMHETTVTEEVFAANPKLKGVVLAGRHSDTIDFDAARRHGVPILTATGLFDPSPRVSRATADLAVGMIVDLAYRISEADRYTRASGFRQEQTMALMGVGCTGRSVGLIGLGRVAQFMVPRLRAFEMQVLYTKRSRLPIEEESALGVTWLPHQDEILRTCDFVSLQCSYNPSTHLLIGERELRLMKPSAYFINTARGRIVDEPALVKALQEGTIAGAGLDVFWHEPPVTPFPWVPPAFYKLDNVVLAPHNGGATWDSRGEMTSRIAQTIVADIKGELPPSARLEESVVV
ncbi:MAG: D-glycerate dehydrogenase [Chloroflexi bacterium]|nr:D-glycerate dehydrogenase [Chloroflexota bacterium]